MFQLAGYTALVTGGSRGIGKATAKALKDLGAEVIIHGTNEDTLKATAESIGGAHIVVANLLEEGAAEALAREALAAAGGKIDILVNNAGITRDGMFIRQKQDQWDDVLRVNLDSVVRLTRALVPGMSERGYGRIVNVSSIVAHMGNIGQTNYITAKAAVTGFTKGLAREYARKGLTVNAVAPGFIETDMTDVIPENLKEGFIKQIPAQRFGRADEVAASIAFLATQEAGYITGTTLHPNGGMYLPG